MHTLEMKIDNKLLCSPAYIKELLLLLINGITRDVIQTTSKYAILKKKLFRPKEKQIISLDFNLNFFFSASLKSKPIVF